jgi:hypothetical protein
VPSLSLSEVRRRFGGRVAMAGGGNAIVTGYSGWSRLAGDGSGGRFVRIRELTRPVHLAEEEQLIDLLQRPAGLADADPGHPAGQLGGLVRRQAPDDQVAVGRSGGQLRGRGVARCPAPGGGGRPRRGPGDPREDRRRGGARRSPRMRSSPCLSCHGSPFRLSSFWADRRVRPGTYAQTDGPGFLHLRTGLLRCG